MADGHGGKREGAGRKPVFSGIKRTFVLRQDQAERLRSEPLTQSETVRNALDLFWRGGRKSR